MTVGYWSELQRIQNVTPRLLSDPCLIGFPLVCLGCVLHKVRKSDPDLLRQMCGPTESISVNHSVVYVKHNPYLVSFNCLIVLVNETEILQDLHLVHPCEQWTGSHSGSSNINQANSYFSSFILLFFIFSFPFHPVKTPHRRGWRWK